MSSFPDFTNENLFPPFSACPLFDAEVSSNPSTPTHYLLGEIQQEMTISTSPTFICRDLHGKSFAVTIRLPLDEIKEGVRGGGYDCKKWKKGHLVLLKRARRRGVEAGKQGFIEVKKEDVMIVPVTAKKLTEMNKFAMIREEKFKEFVGSETSMTLKGCQSCGCVKEEKLLKKCQGCRCVWYCGKDCQMTDWNSGGHKTECKVHQAIGNLFNGQQIKSC